jgi:hypothetical protein
MSEIPFLFYLDWKYQIVKEPTWRFMDPDHPSDHEKVHGWMHLRASVKDGIIESMKEIRDSALFWWADTKPSQYDNCCGLSKKGYERLCKAIDVLIESGMIKQLDQFGPEW